ELLAGYTLSTAGAVKLAIYRPVVSRRCRRGADTCIHWQPTKIGLRTRGRTGVNVLTLELGQLPSGEYRLAATPIARSGAAGITRYVRFEMPG
ncbi:MAG TPA: hypothetical protein VES97_06805, partial [Solirubrobacteraceae bacterium]|nr:hypothetical protein [Solirubrobacteraceae bacterium]